MFLICFCCMFCSVFISLFWWEGRGVFVCFVFLERSVCFLRVCFCVSFLNVFFFFFVWVLFFCCFFFCLRVCVLGVFVAFC